MSKWFYQAGGGTGGPVTEGELRSLHAEGKIKPTTFVYEESACGQWRKYEEAFPGPVAPASEDAAAAVQPPPLPPEDSTGGKKPSPLEACVSQSSAGTVAGSQTGGAQPDASGIQIQSTDSGSGSRPNFRHWGLIVVFVIAAWWGISKYQAYRAEADKKEYTRLLAELQRGAGSLGAFNPDPGLRAKWVQFQTATNEAAQRFAEEKYGKARGLCNDAQHLLGTLKDGLQQRAVALKAIELASNSKAEVLPQRPPEGLRDQILQLETAFGLANSNISDGRFEQAAQGASNVLRQLASVAPALVNFKTFQAEMAKLTTDQSKTLKEFGGTNAAELYVAQTNVVKFGPGVTNIAHGISELTARIPIALSHAVHSEEMNFLEQITNRLASAGTRNAALTELRNHLAMKPDHKRAALLFDKEAVFPQLWLEWATQEAQNPGANAAAAWFEIVQCVRDLKIIQDQPQFAPLPGKGIPNDKLLAVAKQAIGTVLGCAPERRWELLQIVNNDFGYDILERLIKECGGFCSKGTLDGILLARLAGKAARLDQPTLANEYLSKSKTLVGPLAKWPKLQEAFAKLCQAAAAVGRGDLPETKPAFAEWPGSVYNLQDYSLDHERTLLLMWIAEEAALQNDKALANEALKGILLIFQGKNVSLAGILKDYNYLAWYVTIQLLLDRADEVKGFTGSADSSGERLGVWSACAAYHLRLGNIPNAKADCAKIPDSPTKFRLETKCRMVESGGKPSAVLPWLQNEKDPANRCAAYAAVAVSLAAMPPKTQ